MIPLEIKILVFSNDIYIAYKAFHFQDIYLRKPRPLRFVARGAEPSCVPSSIHWEEFVSATWSVSIIIPVSANGNLLHSENSRKFLLDEGSRVHYFVM